MELLWFLFFTLKLYIPSTQGCRLWMCNAPENHALLIHSGDGTGIIYPDVVEDRGTMCRTNPKREVDNFKAIEVPEGESVIAACPDNKLQNFEKSSITLTCHNDRLVTEDNDRLVTEDIEVDWFDLECSGKLNPSVLVSDESCGDQQGHIITIGWKIDEKRTVPQIEICCNEGLEITLYAHHFIHGRYIDAKTVEPSRPGFKHGGVYSRNIDNLYKQENQAIVLEKLLGGPNHLVELGITDDYLARGHLAPDADFVTEAEQDATYYFVNVVPQWHKGFNNLKWKELEVATRDLAEEMELTLSIWTGSHGVLNLPDGQGNTIPIYLGQLENENILPVPELMWKVVYNPIGKQSVVFIGRNDIRESNDNAFNKPCQNICSEIKWVKFENDTKKGKIICCSLQDAKKVISTLPELDVTSLLSG